MTAKTAFVFPGQGSQSVGMMSSYLQQYPDVDYFFQQASSILAYDLLTLIVKGPAEKLNQTELTQPALLVSSFAIWSVYQKNSPKTPEFLAGHSLGEYTALLCADVIDYEHAVQLVATRGRLMQQAVPAGVGGMAAIIGLSDDVIESICAEFAGDQVLSAANYNSPGQIVVAGHVEAVTRAMDAAKAQGAKLVKSLPVSVPSHCALLREAADTFAKVLEDTPMRKPRCPVIQNADQS